MPLVSETLQPPHAVATAGVPHRDAPGCGGAAAPVGRLLSRAGDDPPPATGLCRRAFGA